MNNGNNEGLFRAALMESGSLSPYGDVQGAQVFYDDLVRDVGCAGLPDTMECLRDAPFEKIKHGMDASPLFFSYRVSEHS